MSGQLVFPALQNSSAHPACGVLMPPCEKPPGLHHLMAGVVDGRGGVINTSDQGKFVRELRVLRKNFADLDVGIVRPDGLERPANFARRVGLHVPRIELTGRAQIKNHDAGFFRVPFGNGVAALIAAGLDKLSPMAPSTPTCKKVPARNSVASSD